MSIRHEQIPAGDEQARARGAITNAFRLREGWLPFVETTVTVAQSGYGPLVCDGGLGQPPFWLAIACAYLRRGESLAIGYVKGDCAWHYLGEMRAAFAALTAIRDNRDAKLVFPIEWSDKAHVIAELHKLGLLDSCWWCQNPTRDGRQCGECDSCDSHAAGRYRWERQLEREAGKIEFKVPLHAFHEEHRMDWESPAPGPWNKPVSDDIFDCTLARVA